MSVSVLNTTAGLSGKTLALLEGSQTFTGQKTFDVGASAPFVVVSGSAKVANLDADKLDGQTGVDYHDAALLTGIVPVASLTNATPLSLVCGRLTLTTAVPVTVTDVTAATTLYYALYKGNRIALYTGSVWQVFTIAQLSIAVPATTVQMYDVFVDYNAGTPALAVTAWTNDTTRATALALQDGVLVLSGSTGKRYVGSFRTTGVSGQTEDSLTKRFVFNYDNRVSAALRKVDATASWPYTTATWRQSNGAAANMVEIVNGFPESAIDMQFIAYSYNDTGTGVYQNQGIGRDSITAPTRSGTQYSVSANEIKGIVVTLREIPPLGYHYYSMMEASQAGTGISTFIGTAGATAGGTNANSELNGVWEH